MEGIIQGTKTFNNSDLKLQHLTRRHIRRRRIDSIHRRTDCGQNDPQAKRPDTDAGDVEVAVDVGGKVTVDREDVEVAVDVDGKLTVDDKDYLFVRQIDSLFKYTQQPCG